MINLHSRYSTIYVELLVTAIGVIVCVVGSSLIVRKQVGFRELFIAALGVIAILLILTPGDRSVRVGFYAWIGSFALGWRQIWVTSNLKIHPSEAFIWLLFVLLLARRVVRRERLAWPAPAPVAGLMGLGGLAFLVALDRGIRWDVALAEFKLFLVLIPILYVSNEMLSDLRQWHRVLLAITVTTFYITALGLAEYFDPHLVAPLRGFFAEQAILYSQQGFPRADFTFWGGAIASVYLSMVLVPILSGAMVDRNLWQRLFFLITAVLCSLGIYLAGNRGPWLGTATALLVYTVLNWKRGWILLGPYLALLWLLPSSATRHVLAVFEPQQFYDTSVLTRQARLKQALALIQHNPLMGNGWGASGWVHSDLAQIAANLGVPALMLFLGWYLSKMWRLYTIARRPATDSAAGREYAQGLLAGLCSAFVALGTEAIIVLPQVIIPLWFLLALAERLPALLEESSE